MNFPGMLTGHPLFCLGTQAAWEIILSAVGFVRITFLTKCDSEIATIGGIAFAGYPPEAVLVAAKYEADYFIPSNT